MSVKITITADVDTDSLEDEALWDCEEAVKDTLKEWGFSAKTRASME